MFALFLLIGFVCQTALTSEHICSKFPYDEAMLEKMIRTEIKFEQFQVEFAELRVEVKSTYNRMTNEMQNMATNFQNVLTTVDATVKEIRKERQDMNEDFLNLNKSTMAMLDKAISDNNNMLKLQGKQITRLAKDLRASYRDLQTNITDSTSTPVIGFRATELRDYTLSPGDVLVFSTVAFNKRDGYDSSTGVFTSPISGLYLLTVQVCDDGSYLKAKIMVDERVVGWIDAGDSSYYLDECDTANTLTHMDAGAKAFIITTDGANMQSHNSNLQSFSGALINN